ncbi:Uncharacterised protein [Ralstonia mannitolilytica]|uniref:DUF7694 domain-containing protein n=1 Tax=Ralstonia mannitolilytica TaxID=105219 RepID=UPI000E030351|nr:hypothetical protein [Ralstonia mannitolilytica]SUD94267.1 Uncharacterised protein [Ralstonia mannitolilytica]
MNLMQAAKVSREQRRALERENARQPSILTPVEGWQSAPRKADNLIEVWRSREFLVQVFDEGQGILRASCNRPVYDAATNRWEDGITWDELQRIKREIGRGHLDAVEVFPADRDIVNVANMRHLFIFDKPLPYAWRKT